MQNPSFNSPNRPLQIARILLFALFLICALPNDLVSAIAIFIFLFPGNPSPLFSSFALWLLIVFRKYTRISVPCIFLPLR